MGVNDTVLSEASTIVSSPVPASSQALQQQSSETDEEALGDNAWIKKIVIKNFMCHGHLVVNLRPQLNFICGRNGSGKSAILEALRIGLGASPSGNVATATRIKQGKEQATIIIWIHNPIKRAYRPNEFGETIRIERVIKKNGGSYKLFNDTTNTLVSSEKKELNMLLRRLSLVITNPAMAATQDKIKMLLADNPSDIYKFWALATDEQSMSESSERRNRLLLKLKDSAFQVRKLEKQNNDLLNEYESKRELIEEIQDAERQLDFIRIREVELEQKANEENLANAMSTLEKIVINQVQIENKIDHYTRRVNAAENELKEATDLEKEKQQETQMAIEKLQEYEHKKRSLHQEKKKHMELKARNERDIRRVQLEQERRRKRIDELRQQSHQQELRELSEREQEYVRLDNQLRTVNNELAGFEGTLALCQDDYTVEKDRVAGINRELSELRQRLSMSESELRESERGGQNDLNRFGHNVARAITELINNRGLFQGREPPKGPLGAFIRLKKGFGSWAKAVEAALEKLPFAFATNTVRDMEPFKAISRRHRVALLTSSLRPGQAQLRQEVVREGLRLMDVIEFTDPVAEAFCLDLGNLDLKYLCETPADAKKLLKSLNSKRIQVYLREGQQMTGSASSTTMYGGSALNLRMLFSESKEAQKSVILAQIREYKEQLMRAEEQLRQGHDNLRELEKTLQATQFQYDRHRREAEQLAGRLKQTEDRIMALKQITDSFASQGEMEELTAEAEEATQVLDVLQQSLRNVETACQNSQLEEENIERATMELESAMRAETQEVDERRSIAQQRLQEARQKLETYRERERMLRDMAEQEREKATRARQEIERAKRELEEERRQIPDWDSYERFVRDVEAKGTNLDRLQKQITDRMQEAERNAGTDLETLLNSLHVCREKARTLKRKRQDIEAHHDDMEDSLKKTSHRWKRVMVECINQTSQSFKRFMGMNDMSGHIYLSDDDPQKKLLTIAVLKKEAAETAQSAPKDQNQNRFLKIHAYDGKTKGSDYVNLGMLSGGEKSFTTVCFLTAMNKVLLLPFRAMDEPDVFMDADRQRKSLNLFRKMFTQMNSQTIILTPLYEPVRQEFGASTDEVNLVFLEAPSR